VRCSVLQWVAVCCSGSGWKWVVLQCVAVCCSVLQCVAVCCSELHWLWMRKGDIAVCCSVLQFVAVALDERGWYCSVLQCVASVLQCVAVCCSELHWLWMREGGIGVCGIVLQCVTVCCSGSGWERVVVLTRVDALEIHSCLSLDDDSEFTSQREWTGTYVIVYVCPWFLEKRWQ